MEDVVYDHTVTAGTASLDFVFVRRFSEDELVVAIELLFEKLDIMLSDQVGPGVKTALNTLTGKKHND